MHIDVSLKNTFVPLNVKDFNFFSGFYISWIQIWLTLMMEPKLLKKKSTSEYVFVNKNFQVWLMTACWRFYQLIWSNILKSHWR